MARVRVHGVMEEPVRDQTMTINKDIFNLKDIHPHTKYYCA